MEYWYKLLDIEREDDGDVAMFFIDKPGELITEWSQEQVDHIIHIHGHPMSYEYDGNKIIGLNYKIRKTAP